MGADVLAGGARDATSPPPRVPRLSEADWPPAVDAACAAPPPMRISSSHALRPSAMRSSAFSSSPLAFSWTALPGGLYAIALRKMRRTSRCSDANERYALRLRLALTVP